MNNREGGKEAETAADIRRRMQRVFAPFEQECRDRYTGDLLSADASEREIYLRDVKPLLSRLKVSKEESRYSIGDNPTVPRGVAESGFFQEFEKRLHEWGADAVGYVSVPPHAILNGKEILYPHAVVITIPMDREKMNTAPGILSLDAAVRSYADLGEIVNHAARFLRENGYAAQADPAFGGKTSYPYLAELAGLGIRGRHGLLISRVNGPCQRIAAIYTSITNIPVRISGEYDWIRMQCDNCGACIRGCPGGAIQPKPFLVADREVHLDSKRCWEYFENHYGCGVCVRICPFHSVGYELIFSRYLHNL